MLLGYWCVEFCTLLIFLRYLIEMTSLRIKTSVVDDITIMRADERFVMSELLCDRLLETHASRTRKIPWDFFLSHSRPSRSQRVERSGCRKFNLIADTIFDWQTAREHVCVCESEGKSKRERGRKKRERKREKMNGTESVTSRIVRLRRSFSSPSVPLSCLRFIFRRGFIVHSFADIRNLARQAVDWTVQCPSERYFSFSIWFVGVSKMCAWIFYFLSS